MIINLEEFKNRNKPLTFAWNFEPTKFYSINFKDLDRIFELLDYNKETSIILKYR